MVREEVKVNKVMELVKSTVIRETTKGREMESIINRGGELYTVKYFVEDRTNKVSYLRDGRGNILWEKLEGKK